MNEVVRLGSPGEASASTQVKSDNGPSVGMVGVDSDVKYYTRLFVCNISDGVTEAAQQP